MKMSTAAQKLAVAELSVTCPATALWSWPSQDLAASLPEPGFVAAFVKPAFDSVLRPASSGSSSCVSSSRGPVPLRCGLGTPAIGFFVCVVGFGFFGPLHFDKTEVVFYLQGTPRSLVCKDCGGDSLAGGTVWVAG